MPTEQELANQYEAAKKSVAVFDLSGWTVLSVTGRDCVKFLHNFCTADIKGLAPGCGCEGFLTNVKARVLGHALIFADKIESRMGLTLIASPGQAANLVSHLDRYVITEDVIIHDRTSEAALRYLAGPKSETILKEVGIILPEASPAPHHFTSAFHSGVALRRADIFGLPGFFLDAVEKTTEASLLSDISVGAVKAAPEVFDLLRIEAGFPLYGRDLSEEHLAPEVGRPWAISYTKGCYLGQEPIARIDALGHVNRQLSMLTIESDADSTPEVGSIVLVEGKEIGTITSAAKSCSDRRSYALAFLKIKNAQSGAIVNVQTPEGELTATVYQAS